jgi:hypothetical protein
VVDPALFQIRLSGIPGCDRIGTMLGLLSDHTHAGVDNRTHHQVLLLALGRLPPLGFVGGVQTRLLLVLVLQEKNGVVKGLVAVRGNLPSISPRDAQLREGTLLLLLLPWRVGLGQLARGGLGGASEGLFLRLLVCSRHEAVQACVFKGDHALLRLSLSPLLRLVAAMRGSTAPLHMNK